MLLLIDNRPQRPRREPPNVPWRGIAVAATSIGLGIGSGLVDGIASYGMLLGAVDRGGHRVPGRPGDPVVGHARPQAVTQAARATSEYSSGSDGTSGGKR